MLGDQKPDQQAGSVPKHTERPTKLGKCAHRESENISVTPTHHYMQSFQIHPLLRGGKLTGGKLWISQCAHTRLRVANKGRWAWQQTMSLTLAGGPG